MRWFVQGRTVSIWMLRSPICCPLVCHPGVTGQRGILERVGPLTLNNATSPINPDPQNSHISSWRIISCFILIESCHSQLSSSIRSNPKGLSQVNHLPWIPFYMGSCILTSPVQPLDAVPVSSSRGHLTRIGYGTHTLGLPTSLHGKKTRSK